MKSYWDRRAEADMDRLQAQAARRLRVISKSILEAQSYLTEEAEKILGKYQKRFGLTREEAIEELSKPITRAEYDRLLIRLATMPEGDEKRLLEARINSGAYAYRISRAEALRENIAIETAKVAQIAEEQAAAQFEYTGKEAYARKLFSIQQQADQLFAVPDIDTFKVSSQSPWFGGDYSANIWKNRDALAEALEQKITAGYLSGRSNAKIAQDIQDQFGVSFRVAERLVRTETAYISGQSDLAAYRRSGVRWYRFVATLDTRTCDDCGPMDMTVYEVEKARVGENYPPMHPWCRCTTVAVWDKDRPMEGTRFARDAAGNAIRVPKGMTFEEWKKWQREQAGQERFEALQKMARNKAGDMAQYEKYRGVVGKNEFTSSFEAFQNVKYSNPEAYRFLKLDYKRRSALLEDSSLGLPNAANAIAAAGKFTGYLFNPENPGGWAKGVAFDSRLGYNGDNWKDLRKAILKGASRYPSVFRAEDQCGNSYKQEMILYGNKGKPANVVVGWKVLEGKTWLSSAYLKEVR